MCFIIRILSPSHLDIQTMPILNLNCLKNAKKHARTYDFLPILGHWMRQKSYLGVQSHLDKNVLKTFQGAHKSKFQPVMKVTKQRRLETTAQQRNQGLSAIMNLSHIWSKSEQESFTSVGSSFYQKCFNKLNFNLNKSWLFEILNTFQEPLSKV